MITIGILLTLLAGWIYEFVAIKWRLWPTITDLVRAGRDHLFVAGGVGFAIVAAAAWAIWHLLIQN